MSSQYSDADLSALIGAAKPASRRQGLKSIFACACSAGAGGLLAHTGCIATPLSWAFLASSPALSHWANLSAQMMPAISSTGTALGLGAWYAMRGRKAANTERAATVISAIAGTYIMLAYHGAAPNPFQGAKHNGHYNELVNGLTQMDGTQKNFAANAILSGLPADVVVKSKICTQPEPQAKPLTSTPLRAEIK